MFHLIAFAVCLSLYFLPSIIGRNKRNFAAIFLLNLLLGWTVIGWIVALVWALTVDAASLPGTSAQPSCSVCRTPIRAGQNFCPGCGNPIAWPHGAPASGTRV
jgi:hypothetical protein